MLFQQTYAKSSGVRQVDGRTMVDLAPDLGRDPTYFRGKILDPVRYRDAMIALRDVVVSDLRYKPKDHSAYQAWVQEQYMLEIAEKLDRKQEVQQRLKEVRERMNLLAKRREKRMGDYWKARNRYFDWLRRNHPDWVWVLDPVITVAPDQVFFEAFSQDESSYARLAVHSDLFDDVKEFEYGTTNIDFSDALLDEMRRIRTYRPTEFSVDPSGFEVATEGREVYKEKKIDVPESWIRGFLQVQSAMGMKAAVFEAAPVDFYNLCSFLRRKREKHGPRSLRWVLRPGERIRVVIEPWDEVLVLSNSVWQGDEAREIRVWGRRRLFLLEKLLPLAKKITVHLPGSGLPHFYVADLGSLSFTLGLSGWTQNDWASSANFDLMTGIGEDVDPHESARVFSKLKWKKTGSAGELASWTGLPSATVQEALRQLCAAGRVMYDLEIGKYRLRELTRDPLPLDDLRYAHPREEEAASFIRYGKVRLCDTMNHADGSVELKGTTEERRGRIQETGVILDSDGRLKDGTCSCRLYRHSRLTKGPCAHMLSLMVLSRRQERMTGGEQGV
ncbi:SWIM zinc finger family protein [Staphylospora marina]|uniref:SWIM zinc finger family protein n=1 Tax=Staphylospora marina TaxID=2490858 RepID=UPI000F5C0AFB|nr:SWIM zinc finger family protein [Staphylospora marina]